MLHDVFGFSLLRRRPTSARRVAVIVGMHRSGTSMLARLLASRGLPLGERLLNTAQPDNAHGYWEHADVVQVQEALLDGMDRTWYGPNGGLPLPEGWMARPATRAAKQRLMDIIGAELATSPGLWGFKDPRTVRFLPLWKEIIADLGVEPVWILAIRNPVAVAGSLMRRNRMTADHAESIWALHNLDAIDHIGGDIAAVVDYDSWFEGGVGIAEQLVRVLGLGAPPEGGEMTALIDAELRHHDGRMARARPAVADFYDALRAHAPLPPRLGAADPVVVRVRAELAERFGWKPAGEQARGTP